MNQHKDEPDDVAAAKARATEEGRQAVADGEAPGSTVLPRTADESSYATEDSQGAAQPEPDGG